MRNVHCIGVRRNYSCYGFGWLCSAIAATIFCLVPMPGYGENSRLKPGVLYLGAPMLFFMVPEHAQGGAHTDIRTVLDIPLSNGRRRKHEDDVEGEILDFDTGQANKFSYTAVRKAPVLDHNPSEVSGPVLDNDGNRYLSYFCGYECLYGTEYLGVIEGEKVRIDHIPVSFSLFGETQDIINHVMPGDPRRAGYVALRAVTEQGKVKWEKVYLVQTNGWYTTTRDDPIAKDVVAPIRGVKYMLPGDKYFYLELNAHAPPAVTFGAVLFRVRLADGMPVTKDPHIKAVDLSQFQQLLNVAASEIERHYRKRNETSEYDYQFVAQPEDRKDAYKWTGDLLDDVPPLINFRIRQHWFRELLK